MKFTEITFHQLFATGSFENQRLEVKGTLEEGETLCQAFLKAKQGIIESFKFINHKDNNPQLTDGEITITSEPYGGMRDSYRQSDSISKPIQSIDRKAIERLEILIDDAKSDKELMPLVDEILKLGLEKQYFTKLQTLQK
jgi:hypothetical protein